MKKYQITYVHNSQKQTIRLEADDKDEANRKFKQIAPDVPEGNILSVVAVLSLKEMLTKKMIVGIFFILIGIFIYTKRLYITILSMRLGSNFNYNPGETISLFFIWGFLLTGIVMILLELLAIYKKKKK